MKKPNEETKEAENDIDVMSFEVSGVRQFKKTVFFNLKLNGVQIYGCTLLQAGIANCPSSYQFLR